ncbi:ABC-three component system protein [Cobetia sp. QF-1]|uniref:ABC-three component system protein n=1 Tax=Cobetia sp. QF-1 TaxID=1969833 RepID=UPI000B53B17B|nr:ABC-three component system protein [Cobetia sp. QF-1]
MTNNANVSKSSFGDFVQGDKYVNAPSLLPLEKAIAAIQASIVDNPQMEEIIEELAEYTTNRPGREIIGVEKKLENGERKDLIDNAVYLKNKFERYLAKRQLSLVEQHVHVHVLAMIDTTFNQKIRPLILDDRSKSEVDTAVHEYIIEPVYQSIVGYNSSVTSSLVAGMLYFLTGKCHLIWGK